MSLDKFLQTCQKTGQTLVLTSCCKEKLDVAAPARELYTGTLFKLVKTYAEENNFDWRIISAKHGLVMPDQMIEPYDAQVKSVGDVARVQQLVLPKLEQIWGGYARIMVIMGKSYRRVINPALMRQQSWARVAGQKVEVIEDARGIGGLLQTVKTLIWKTREEYRQASVRVQIAHANALLASVEIGTYTRKTHPEFCKTCTSRACSFDEKRKCALPNGNDNPESTHCDYCLKLKAQPSPDHYTPERKKVEA